MNPHIASIHQRMSEGGDWRAFRDEIADLHQTARTEAEYVTLLEAHANLVAVGAHIFSEETYGELLPIAQAEYRFFLNREATEFGLINPARLDYVTRREVEAGRLAPNDDFRPMAEAAGKVMGDSAHLSLHRCQHGDWFAGGMIAAVGLAYVLERLGMSVFWLIAVGIVAGWILNHRETKRNKANVIEQRLQNYKADTSQQ